LALILLTYSTESLERVIVTLSLRSGLIAFATFLAFV
jgi:hypothetical protein